MSRYALKFPRRVRIHGGEFDESARAIHREDGLKTIQAESGIVLDSTIERKQMSTKTTFKRVALVAVAALGFGVMSVAPSNAAVGFNAMYHMNSTVCNAPSWNCGTSVVDDKSYVLINQRADYGFQNTFLAGSATDTSAATWSLVSSPTGFNTPLISSTFWKSTDANGPTYTAPTGGGGGIGGWFLAGTANESVGAAVTNGTGAATGLTLTTTATAAGATVGNWQSSFTPTAAGVYVWKLTAGTTSYTWTVNAYATQVALDAGLGVDNALSATKTTSILNTGETSTATTDATVVVTKALSTDAVATVVVTPKRADDTAITNVTFPITATISGPGSLRIGANLAAATASPAGRAVTGATGEYYVGVFSDGTSGVATITISSGTTKLSEEKVTFYGTATTITPTIVKSVLARGANAGAVTAIVTDSNGVPVYNQAVWSLSDTAAVIAATPVACTNTDATGLTTCGLTGVADAAGSATIKLMNAATVADSTIVATAGSVRVSDGVATKVAFAFDKATYAPGEAAKVSATVSNAAGPLPEGSYAVLTGAVTTNYALGGSALPSGNVTVGVNGAATTTSVVMATGISGTVQLAATAAATTIAVTAGSADVVNEALDAALEAIDAAENARLAAEAAIEAATDAQAAAEDATAAAEQAGTDAVTAAEAAGESAVAAADAAGAAAMEAANAATAAAEEAALAAVEAGEMAVAAAEAAGAIAQDALDAAIAATDAAVEATEAATAAGAIATEAKEAALAATAAVEALSTKVATLVAGLNAKVTTLSNLLAKIAKKLNVK